jgi:hypothetical protein
MVSTDREWLHRVDCGPSRFARPGDADELKAVIYCLKPRRPTLRPSQRNRWQLEGRRDILHEKLAPWNAGAATMEIMPHIRILDFRLTVRDGEVFV